MNRTIGEQLARNLGAAIFGRAGERRALRSLLSGDAPLVIYLHGLSGIGKSTLSAALCREARELGGRAIGLDGRLIEPTRHGFLTEMANALRCAPNLTAVRDSLAGLPRPVLIALDGYELLTLLDAWLRQVLIPALPGTARVLVCSRLPPSPGWLEAPEWRGLLRVLRLEGLDEEAANAFLMCFSSNDHAVLGHAV
jgi:hypothetical protein